MTTTPVMKTGSVMPAPNVKGSPRQPEEGASFADMFKQSAEMQRSAPDLVQSVPETGSSAVHIEKNTAQKDVTGAQQSETKAKPAQKAEQTAKKTESAEESDNAETGEVTEEPVSEEALEEAAQQVVSMVAQTLGITPEDVAAAMEDLGMSEQDLFQTGNLQQLFAVLSGEPDGSFLLTGGELAEDFNALLGEISQLAEELDGTTVMPEEQPQIVTGRTGETEDADIPDVERTPEDVQYTVTIQRDGKQVSYEMSQDGESGIASTTGTTEVELPQNPQAGSDGTDGRNRRETGEQSKEVAGMMQETGASFHEVNIEPEFVQTVERFASDQTQDIMNQIMDRMRIDQLGDFTKLEMQLHPASLGRVMIEIVSRNGEMTAQITTQNEAVKAAMESQLVQLKENLSEQGLKVESVEVTVESHAYEQNYEGQRQPGEDAGESAGARNRNRTHRINLNELDSIEEEDLTDEERMVAELMADRGGTVDYTV